MIVKPNQRKEEYMALKNFYREIFDNISVSPYVGRNPNSAS
jgi:hypothetical protein